MDILRPRGGNRLTQGQGLGRDFDPAKPGRQLGYGVAPRPIVHRNQPQRIDKPGRDGTKFMNMRHDRQLLYDPTRAGGRGRIIWHGPPNTLPRESMLVSLYANASQ